MRSSLRRLVLLQLDKSACLESVAMWYGEQQHCTVRTPAQMSQTACTHMCCCECITIQVCLRSGVCCVASNVHVLHSIQYWGYTCTAGWHKEVSVKARRTVYKEAADLLCSVTKRIVQLCTFSTQHIACRVAKTPNLHDMV